MQCHWKNGIPSVLTWNFNLKLTIVRWNNSHQMYKHKTNTWGKFSQTSDCVTQNPRLCVQVTSLSIGTQHYAYILLFNIQVNWLWKITTDFSLVCLSARKGSWEQLLTCFVMQAVSLIAIHLFISVAIITNFVPQWQRIWLQIRRLYIQDTSGTLQMIRRQRAKLGRRNQASSLHSDTAESLKRGVNPHKNT